MALKISNVFGGLRFSKIFFAIFAIILFFSFSNSAFASSYKFHQTLYMVGFPYYGSFDIPTDSLADTSQVNFSTHVVSQTGNCTLGDIDYPHTNTTDIWPSTLYYSGVSHCNLDLDSLSLPDASYYLFTNNPFGYNFFTVAGGAISFISSAIPRGDVNISSNINTNTTWSSDNIYEVSGDIEIGTGYTLTIEPGTIIKFDIGSSLMVNGTLISEGDYDNDNHVIFTSAESAPAAGDWDGIIIGSGGNATLHYSIVRYAGGGGNTAQIYNDGGTLTIDEHSSVVFGTTYGIYNDSGTTNITSSELGFNGYGLYVDGGTASFDVDMLSNPNIIHDNSSYGVYNNTVSTVDAENSYWGDTTGPSNYGPGSGDAVSNYVNFDDFIDHDLNYTTNSLFEDYCEDFNECTSVYDDIFLWKNDNVTYTTELSNALSTWDGVYNSPLTFTEDNYTPNIIFKQNNYGDVSWVGKGVFENIPDNILLNSYYLDNDTSGQIQHTITHEIGHALGLYHSYSGNIMYFSQTAQTTLGGQDLIDFNSLWH